jgi:hypothetical protein
MARVKLEAGMGMGILGLSGRVGNLVFRTMADGQTYAQQAPAPAQRGPTAVAQRHI